MRHALACAILLLAALLTGCGSQSAGTATAPSGAATTSTAAGEAIASATMPGAMPTSPSVAPTAEPPVVAPTEVAGPTPEPIVAPEPDASVTAEPPPSPTPTLPAPRGSLRLGQWGYSQAEAYAEVSWGFVVTNQDRANAVLDTAYVLTFVDDTGTTIKADEGYIDYIMPGAEQGVGGSTFLPAGAIAQSMRVDLRPGTLAPAPIQPAITIDDVTYFERSLFPIATGVASVTFDRPLEALRVYAVGYDRNDAIIGGGNAYLPFVLPGRPAGVEVSIPSVGQPARIKLYPALTAETIRSDDRARLDEPSPPVAVDQEGWGIVASSGEIGWGFLLHNPSASRAIEPVLYQVTAWAADGTVLATNAADIAIVLPGERLGIGGSVFAPNGATPDHVDVQILGRSYNEVNTPARVLTVDDVRIVPDTLTPRATGVVTNGLDGDLTSVEVFAVGYDANDAIIGGGLAFIESLPALGEASVDVALAVGGSLARVELYATVSSASQVP